MAITITLDERPFGEGLATIEAGVTEEGGQVALELRLAPGELTGRGSRLEVKPYDEPVEPDVVTMGGEEVPLPGNRANVEAARDHYRAEADRLAKLIRTVHDERGLERRLLPDEARELAAVLWHYAGEAER